MLNIIEKIRARRKWSRFVYDWQTRNSHNGIIPGCYFNIKNVFSGKKSYGTLNIIDSTTHMGGGWGILKIGNYCSIAQGVWFLLGAEHHTDTISTYPFKVMSFGLEEREGFSKGDIIVDDDVWIGMNALICSGVRIHQGAVIAAGAVVSKDVPPYAVVGGNPIRIIKFRFNEEIRAILLKTDICKLFDSFTKTDIDFIYSPLTQEVLDRILHKRVIDE